jgi:hypothetical protein
VQVKEAQADPARRRFSGRVLTAAALLVIGVLAAPVLAGVSLTPRSNACIALVVFGGMLGGVLLFQRLVPRRRPDSTDREARG